MAPQKLLPRQILARNLKALLNKTGLSASEVAKKAGVDRKTINNQLNARYDPRPEQVDAVASVFGFNHWDLLSPHFNADRKSNERLRALIDLYATADDKGQENILRIAEMAATYRK
jgi:transcriptional regulator with XRE-family HTH domain